MHGPRGVKITMLSHPLPLLSLTARSLYLSVSISISLLNSVIVTMLAALFGALESEAVCV
jgi:hypothetical protein